MTRLHSPGSDCPALGTKQDSPAPKRSSFTFPFTGIAASPMQFTATRRSHAKGKPQPSPANNTFAQSTCSQPAGRGAGIPVLTCNLNARLRQQSKHRTDSTRGPEALPLAFSSSQLSPSALCSAGSVLPGALVCDQARGRNKSGVALASTLALCATQLQSPAGSVASLGSTAGSAGTAPVNCTPQRPTAQREGVPRSVDGQQSTDASGEHGTGSSDGQHAAQPAASTQTKSRRGGKAAAGSAVQVQEDAPVNLDRLKMMAGWAPVLAGGRRVCLRRK